MYMYHFPLNPTISLVSVLQITTEQTESLVEGGPYAFIRKSEKDKNLKKII